MYGLFSGIEFVVAAENFRGIVHFFFILWIVVNNARMEECECRGDQDSPLHRGRLISILVSVHRQEWSASSRKMISMFFFVPSLIFLTWTGL
jgi:hypothetical protein